LDVYFALCRVVCGLVVVVSFEGKFPELIDSLVGKACFLYEFDEAFIMLKPR
jgi:hypothetical protein